MNNLWTLWEISINLFQGMMMSYYAYSFLGDKSNKPYLKSAGVVCALVLSAVITVLNMMTAFEHFFSLIYIAVIFIYSIGYLNGSLMKKLFASSFPLLILLILSAFSANFFAVLFGISKYEILTVYNAGRLIAVLMVQVVLFYMYALTLKIFKKNKSGISELAVGEWLLIIIVLIWSITIAALLSLISLGNIQQTYRMYIVVSFIGLVLINIATFFTVLRLSKKNETERENELLKLQNIYNKQYIANAKTEYEIIRKIRHDFKDKIGVVHALLSEDKKEKAMRYIEENLSLLENTERFIHTDNDIVNAVINSKLSSAKSLGIDITCLSVAEFNGINDMDLCSLLSNMLENAISACLEVQEGVKYIYTKISFDGSKYIFNVKNSISKSILDSNPTLATTKKNKDHHGYGVKIIRDIAEKYDGNFDFYEINDFFCCNVILYIS